MISIIDYGLGNINAFLNIYKKLNIDACTVRNENQIIDSKKFILPGVGSFDWAMTLLQKSKLIDPLNHMVLKKKTPILGVCIGMQIMGSSSEEGNAAGLSWLDFEVISLKFKKTDRFKVPHMGWNQVSILNSNKLFKDIPDKSEFYFLHSYTCDLKDLRNHTSQTTYGSNFLSSFACDNIFGVQFHPEKSHQHGENLLKNFSKF